MLARIRKAMNEREEGFTLIELLVVVIIIGILAAIAIPVFLNQRQKAHDAAAESDLKSVGTAEEAYLTTPGTIAYTTATAELTANGYRPSQGVTMTVGVDGTKGFCAVATNTQGTGKFYLYDSTNGGFQDKTYTDATTAAGDCKDTTAGTAVGALT